MADPGNDVDPSGWPEGIDLHLGERIVWAQTGSGNAAMPSRRTVDMPLWQQNLSPLTSAVLVLVGLAAALTIRVFELTGLAQSVVSVVAFTAIFLGGGYFIERLFQVSGLATALVGRTRTFLSCVITDRRILLINDDKGHTVSLPRNRVTSIKPGYAEGAPALLFRRDGSRDTFAFISPIDFTPALRALDR
ncbi:hypothetical protein [uncultured Algimonas sp.]|uniref:hypothetical protein n=1 Tax=uncultured Algimonas sp. TaxID=1547920 RepID=UPI0026078F39|nr:hypothetical protein [uncultured Algimonas sp.]